MGIGVGYKEQLMALLTIIEDQHRLEELASLSKLGMKGSNDIRNLECSIKYDIRGESSSRGKGKDKGFSVFL